MNYYEELDISPNASLEEIHQAYRLAARLLHPDTQPDPRLKSAAERQMVRLNGILATLTDPEKRFEYDESLCQGFAIAGPVKAPGRVPMGLLRKHWPWGLACCILLVAGLSYMRSNEPGEPARSRPSNFPSPATTLQAVPGDRMPVAPRTYDRHPLHEQGQQGSAAPRAKASPWRPHFETGVQESTGRSVERPPEPGEAATTSRQARETTAAPGKTDPAAKEATGGAPLASEQPGTPLLTGHWLYAAGTLDPEAPGMYPPEFIELFLAENQGALSGKYWARYRIANQAVSPEVQFRVYGTPLKTTATANPATLQWVSDDGAKGQLKMVLRGANSMEVTWWTSEFGRRTALTSGTALLVRQQIR